MLQRVQTIYMLASVIALLTMHFFWLASFAMPEATFELNSMGLVCTSPGFETDQMNWLIFPLLVLMMAIPLVTIFLYKNRKLQLRLLIFATVLNALYYGVYFWQVSVYSDQIFALSVSKTLDETNNIIMLAMPLLSIFCNIMAMRGVIYDIALIKGLERLR